jgi:TrmH family RNA methyltransferase
MGSGVYTRLGRGHPDLRRLRALRRDRTARDAAGVLVAEGIHLAAEALAAGAPVERALVAPSLQEGEEGRALLEALRSHGIPVFEVDDAVMEGLQDARTPQPVLLLVRRGEASLAQAVPGLPGVALVAVAAGIQDPGNLGAILRSADAAGATGCVALGAGADLFHPRTVRASMGAIFRLPCAQENDVAPLLARLRTLGIGTLAAHPGAELLYDLCDLRVPTALFFGGEGAGLPPDLSRQLDVAVKIPMRPGVESLSVAAAAAVLLFEAARQRRV